ncbi:hypothetical protein D9M69_626920 [compost metagenome]
MQHAVYLLLKLKFPLKALHGYGENGVFYLVRQEILVQEAYGAVARFRNTTGVRLIFAHHQLQQRGFPFPVQTYQPDLVFGFDL